MTKKSNSFDFVAQKNGFLGVEEKYLKSPNDAKVIVVPFGLEKSVSYGGGTRNGPKAIIKSSHQAELFDEEFWYEPFRKYGVATLKEIKIDANIPKALKQLEKITAQILDAGKFPLILGGEHFSHAAALRRVMDNPISTLISCGIRNISAGEIPYLEANSKRIKIHFAKDRRNWDAKKIVAPLKGRPVFLTFDLDGFDSSLMQATGTTEPGGMMWDDALDIIREASKICNIVGADVVELAPVKAFHSCDFLAAKLCYKILNFALLKAPKL